MTSLPCNCVLDGETWASARRWLRPTLWLTLVWLAMGCERNEAGSDAKAPDVDPPARAAAPAREGLLKPGATAPEFEAVSHTGQPVKLSDLRGKVVILYFYPKDNTPGCTTEARNFAQEYQDLEQAGAVVLGVSSDDNESHRRFAEEHGLPFLLLPDTERSIAEAYGVGSFLGMTSRVTYLIDRKGKIAKVYPSVDPNTHAERILEDLESLN